MTYSSSRFIQREVAFPAFYDFDNFACLSLATIRSVGCDGELSLDGVSVVVLAINSARCKVNGLRGTLANALTEKGVAIHLIS